MPISARRRRLNRLSTSFVEAPSSLLNSREWLTRSIGSDACSAIPGAGLVGVNRCSAGDVLPDHGDRGALAWHDEWQGTTKDLTGDDNHLAFAGLLFCRTAVGTVLFAIRLPDLAAEIRAIDRDGAGEFGLVRVMDLRAHRLAQLMREDERCLVLDVEISA